MTSSLAAILDGSDRSPRATLIRTALLPLEGLHRLGLAVYLLPFQIGLRCRHRLSVPVVSIGNLASGGTGKTPMTVAVAGLLRDLGMRPVVLSRGHGGSHERERGALVVSDGGPVPCATPEQAGDEPVLIARALPGVPVVVGRDRRVTGSYAIERFSPDVLLLDDGLQFWQLHRDLDICLLDTRRPFDNGHLIPRGLLREPAFHLRRAGAVVLTRYARASTVQQSRARGWVGQNAPDALLLAGDHAPLGWVDGSGHVEPAEWVNGKAVRVLTGIADGAGFVETVRGLGAIVADAHIHPDHHGFTDDDIRAAANSTVDAVVVTEKDAVKLADRWPENAPPLWVLRIALRLDNPDSLRDLLGRACSGPGSRE